MSDDTRARLETIGRWAEQQQRPRGASAFVAELAEWWVEAGARYYGPGVNEDDGLHSLMATALRLAGRPVPDGLEPADCRPSVLEQAAAAVRLERDDRGFLVADRVAGSSGAYVEAAAVVAGVVRLRMSAPIGASVVHLTQSEARAIAVRLLAIVDALEEG